MTRRLIATVGCYLLGLGGVRVAVAQTAPPSAPRSVRIYGRIILPDSSGVSTQVQMVRIAPDGVTVESPVETVKAGPNGVFTFFGEPLKKYQISVECSLTHNKDVFTGTGKSSVNVGDVIFDRTPIAGSISAPPRIEVAADLRPEQIIIEPQSGVSGVLGSFPRLFPAPSLHKTMDLPPCWSGSPLDWRAAWESSPMVEFNGAISIGSFVGGRAKLVRVVHYDPKLSPSQIRAEVRKVWLGTFRQAAIGIMWSEGSPWNIDAVIEYEDGKRSSILMDGWIHVHVQDHEGKYWFIRL